MLGLDHPDDHGQRVAAVMNSGDEFPDRLAPDDVAGVQAIYGRDPAYVAPVKGFLENPGHRSFWSGIGVISGWICEAETVTLMVGEHRISTIYGTERPDTASICGDSNNGFVTLFNWSRLPTGTHTARLLVDGQQHGGPVEFKVTALDSFIDYDPAYMRHTVPGFPRRGNGAVVGWNTNSQSFTIMEIIPHYSPPE